MRISLYRTDKCVKCYMTLINGGCLLIDIEKMQPPKCKDGTCNLRILNRPNSFQEWFIKAVKEQEK